MSGKKAKRSKKTSLRDKADKLFSEYIRRKYADSDGYVKCYTCGKKAFWRGEGMQCGHYASRRHSNTRFDEENARVQCYGCNVGRGGNYPVYSERLIAEKGPDIIKELNKKSHIIVKIDEKWYEDHIAKIKKNLDLLA